MLPATTFRTSLRSSESWSGGRCLHGRGHLRQHDARDDGILGRRPDADDQQRRQPAPEGGEHAVVRRQGMQVALAAPATHDGNRARAAQSDRQPPRAPTPPAQESTRTSGSVSPLLPDCRCIRTGAAQDLAPAGGLRSISADHQVRTHRLPVRLRSVYVTPVLRQRYSRPCRVHGRARIRRLPPSRTFALRT